MKRFRAPYINIACFIRMGNKPYSLRNIYDAVRHLGTAVQLLDLMKYPGVVALNSLSLYCLVDRNVVASLLQGLSLHLGNLITRSWNLAEFIRRSKSNIREYSTGLIGKDMGLLESNGTRLHVFDVSNA